jgi:hypothetical protein
VDVVEPAPAGGGSTGGEVGSPVEPALEPSVGDLATHRTPPSEKTPAGRRIGQRVVTPRPFLLGRRRGATVPDGAPTASSLWHPFPVRPTREPPVTFAQLLSLLLRDHLYELAWQFDLVGYSRATKPELVDALLSVGPAELVLPRLDKPVLRALAADLGLRVSGTKDDLLERVLDLLIDEDDEDDEDEDEDEDEDDEDDQDEDDQDEDEDDVLEDRDPQNRLAWALLAALPKDVLLAIALDRLGDPDVRARWGATRIAAELRRYPVDEVLGALLLADLRQVNQVTRQIRVGPKAALSEALRAWVFAHEAPPAPLVVPNPPAWRPQEGGHRVKALLIGNGAYPDRDRLHNPEKDIADLGVTLRRLGHLVESHPNLGRRAMTRVVNAFARGIGPDDKVLFYFSGHGVAHHGALYLLPLDYEAESEDDLHTEAITLDQVTRKLRHGRMRVVIIDACRSPAFRPKSRGLAGGAAEAIRPAQVDDTEGTLICFATGPESTASDGEPGENGLYTEALLRHLPVPGRRIHEVMLEVRREVKARSGGEQVPWEHSCLTGDWFPAGPGPGGPAR